MNLFPCRLFLCPFPTNRNRDQRDGFGRPAQRYQRKGRAGTERETSARRAVRGNPRTEDSIRRGVFFVPVAAGDFPAAERVVPDAENDSRNRERGNPDVENSNPFAECSVPVAENGFLCAENHFPQTLPRVPRQVCVLLHRPRVSNCPAYTHIYAI